MNTHQVPIESDSALFEHHQIAVDPKQTLLRIDKFLTDRLPNTTRNKIQIAIENGFIRVNNRTTKTSYKVRAGDLIKIVLPTPPRITDIEPEAIPLSIVYEDDHLLVVNKPADMVVHPAYENWHGTLVNALLYYLKDLPQRPGNLASPGLVHRIDKDTSGLLVVAKDEVSMIGLARQFYNHSIQRTYYALVWGLPEEEHGTINVKVGKSPHDRRVVMAYPDGKVGKHAVTHYKVLETFFHTALIQCNLETGRTHQIRAHMKYLGHPLFGDHRYGGDKVLKGPHHFQYKQFAKECLASMPRQALHALSLGFEHPVTKENMYFESKLPDDFEKLLQQWQMYKEQHTM